MRTYLSSVSTRSGEIVLPSKDRRFAHAWTPEGETPWGTMAIIHGFGDHSGRFSGMATSLASMGVAVTAIDLVGHGRSPGRRGCIESYDQLLDEVDSIIEYCSERFANSPMFIFGQSMGGNIVLNWALRRGSSTTKIRGILSGSPMLRTPNMPQEKFLNAGRWLAHKFPNLRIPTPVQVERLSQDRRAQDAYLRDPFVHRSMSLRLALSLIDSGQWAIENASQLSIPTLLMHGSEDTLTCPAATSEFAERAGSIAQFRSWSGCRHDLHDEPQRERVFAWMTRWMKEQCISLGRLSLPKQANVATAA